MAKQAAIGYEVSNEWKPYDTGGTLVRATNLNHIEQGIANACAGVDQLRTKRLPTYLVASDGDTAENDINDEAIFGPSLILDLSDSTLWYDNGEDGEVHRRDKVVSGSESELHFQDEAGLYEGRNIEAVFADEIEDYGDVWEFLQARAQAGNFSGLRIGDYVDTKLTDQTDYRAVIGAIDPYYKCGDDGHVRGHHIAMISSKPVSVSGSYAVNGSYIKWNNNANNNGNSTNKAPYLASNLHSWEEGTFYNLLPAALKNRIMVHRALLEERYSSSGTLTESGGWNWYDLGHIWSLSEMEVYGCQVWGTKGWSVGYDCQFPYFKNTKRRQDGARVSWWLRSVRGGSSSDVCIVGSTGDAGHYSAAAGWIRPRPCFLIG